MFSVFLNISNFEKEWSHHHGNYIYWRRISRCMSNFVLLSFPISQQPPCFFFNSYQVQRQRWTGKIEQTKPWLIFAGKHPYPSFVCKRFDFVMSLKFWAYQFCKGSKNFLKYCRTCMLSASLIQHFGCKMLDTLEHLVEWCSKLLDHWSDLNELKLLGPFWPRDLVLLTNKEALTFVCSVLLQSTQEAVRVWKKCRWKHET